MEQLISRYVNDLKTQKKRMSEVKEVLENAKTLLKTYNKLFVKTESRFSNKAKLSYRNLMKSFFRTTGQRLIVPLKALKNRVSASVRQLNKLRLKLKEVEQLKEVDQLKKDAENLQPQINDTYYEVTILQDRISDEQVLSERLLSDLIRRVYKDVVKKIKKLAARKKRAS